MPPLWSTFRRRVCVPTVTVWVPRWSYDWCPVRVYSLSPSVIGACRLAWQVSVLVSARDAICSGDRDFLVAKDGLGV
eukprot:4841066-Pyramimonas_sp.AAC.1